MLRGTFHNPKGQAVAVVDSATRTLRKRIEPKHILVIIPRGKGPGFGFDKGEFDRLSPRFDTVVVEVVYNKGMGDAEYVITYTASKEHLLAHYELVSYGTHGLQYAFGRKFFSERDPRKPTLDMEQGDAAGQV